MLKKKRRRKNAKKIGDKKEVQMDKEKHKE